MPKLPRLTATESEKLLAQAGFSLLRTKGSHKIFIKNTRRIVIPFHAGKILHPKIVKQVFSAIEAEK